MSPTTEIWEFFPGSDGLLEETKEKIWSVHFVGEMRGYIKGFILGDRRTLSENKLTHTIYMSYKNQIVDRITEKIIDVIDTVTGGIDIYLPSAFGTIDKLIRNTIDCLDNSGYMSEDMLIRDSLDKASEIVKQKVEEYKSRQKV